MAGFFKEKKDLGERFYFRWVTCYIIKKVRCVLLNVFLNNLTSASAPVLPNCSFTCRMDWNETMGREIKS